MKKIPIDPNLSGFFIFIRSQTLGISLNHVPAECNIFYSEHQNKRIFATIGGRKSNIRLLLNASKLCLKHKMRPRFILNNSLTIEK